MAGGIDRDGGGIDMYPDQAKAAITALDQTVTRIADAVRSRINEIAGLDSQLGTDFFSTGFAMQYQPFVDELVPQVNELNDTARGWAATGQSCVAQYVLQDQANKATVQGSGQ